nr:hypothetical protein [Bacteroidota bacterium]
GTVTYSDAFNYTPDMNESELVVNPMAFIPKVPLSSSMTLEDVTKVPGAVRLGETKLADGVIFTSTRIEVENEIREVIEVGEEVIQKDAQGNIKLEVYDIQIAKDIDLMELTPHGYEKVTIVTETAEVYFAKNLFNYNKSLKWNKKEDVPSQLEGLYDFVRKGWKIKDIVIDGWASPEGEETYNDGLSENRAKTAEWMLLKAFKKIAKEKETKVQFTNPKEDISIKYTGHGPDWSGFINLLEKSTIADKRAMINVINRASADKKEGEIKNMILIYPEIEDLLLPPLRRAEVVINCYEPKKTDAEIARLATTNPGELSKAELLYGATLTPDWNTKYKIYKSAASKYPDCWAAQNNAGYMAIKLGKIDDAIKYFEKAQNLNSSNGGIVNNLGVAYAYKKDYQNAEKYLKKANQMGVDNNYNLGIIDISKGDFKNALTKFSGVQCDYNVALAQVMNEDYNTAAANLECARKNGASYYLLAIIGARTNNETLLFSNLKKAIKANAKYKAEAAKDREFIKYFDNADFTGIVQ